MTILKSIAHYTPQKIVTSHNIEEKIRENSTFDSFSSWIIEQISGVQQRQYASPGEFTSTFAIKASQKAIIQAEINPEDIDLIIFAAVGQDILEPATANIVQKELWLSCPVFDIKNACNSFINAIQIADSFIQNNQYQNILICNWETSSQTIKRSVSNKQEFKEAFSWYTLWDGGAAMIVGQVEENQNNKTQGIRFSKFYSNGNFWDSTTVMWGGSRHFHDFSKYFFLGNSSKIKDFFLTFQPQNIINEGLQRTWRQVSDIKKVFVHQISMDIFNRFSEATNIPLDKFSIILPQYGNIAAASIPTAISIEHQKSPLQTGDKIILVWFAAGLSFWVLFREI